MRFLAQLDREIEPHIQTIHIVGDQVSTHHGTAVRTWVATHSRFVFHVTPVHGSWMTQVDQWFSIRQRKRLRIADFESKAHLQAKLRQFIGAWNQHAHPLNGSTQSVA
jgi:transposase